MYFFSATDPNYRIKGSRDPLGFQSLWSSAGHMTVKHLSTVSCNLRDFMILSYANYFYGDRDPRGFIRFFLKFEQACAYARWIINNEKSGFNGIDFINRRRDDSSFSISLSPKDTILSNQRTYGIYGKYIRPSRDMGLFEASEYKEVINKSLRKTNLLKLTRILNFLFSDTDTPVILYRDDLKPLAALLKRITPGERDFYRNYILKILSENHPQNSLYEIISKDRSIIDVPFNLHPLINRLVNISGITDDLKFALLNIQSTDRVLHPLNMVFTHFLNKSSWSLKEIEDEKIFMEVPGKINYDFSDPTMRYLNDLLSHSPFDLIENIIKRNAEVSDTRSNQPWVIREKQVYRVIYGENGMKVTSIDNVNGYEFPYFLNIYLGLFRQIEMV
jgi:hypothetical protein